MAQKYLFVADLKKKKKRVMQSIISGNSYLNTAQTCWKCVPGSVLGASLCS